MQARTTGVWLLGAIWVALGACGSNNLGAGDEIDDDLFTPRGDTTRTAAAALPEAEGRAVLNYVLEDAPYTRWDTWPDDGCTDFTTRLPSGSPHGDSVRIFTNDVARGAAGNFTGEMPEGSLILKENYNGPADDSNAELDALTIMYKAAGSNPDGGDWFWLQSSADGSIIEAEGALQTCTNCHAQSGNKDSILRYGFGETPAAVPAGSDLANCYAAQGANQNPGPGGSNTACGNVPGCSTESFGGKTYYFVNDDSVSIDTARTEVCPSLGAQLASIRSDAENNWMRERANQLGMTGGVSIGGTDAVNEERWLWPNGDHFWQGQSGGSAQNGAYTHWAPGEPDNSNGQDSMELRGDGYWNDTDSNNQPFICEAR